MELPEVVKVLDLLIKTPTYSVIGYTHGRLVYLSNAGGVTSLWSLDPARGEPLRLTKEPVHSVAYTSTRSKYVIYTKDVSKGRELQKLFAVGVDGGEERVYADTPPMRFFGLAWDGEKLVFSAATASGISLYLAREGLCEKLMDLDAVMYPTSTEGDIVVGAGTLRKNPRSTELFIYNISTGELRVYTPREGSANKNPAVRDCKILFESNFEGSSKLYIYDLNSDFLTEVRFRYRDYHTYSPVEHLIFGWVDDGRVWAVGKKNGRTKGFIEGREVPSPTGTVGYLAVSGDRVYYSASSLTTPPKVYEADLKSMTYRVLVDNLLPEELDGRLGRAYFTTYQSSDGLEVSAFVVESGVVRKPGPTIVYVHGGPWSEVYDQWSVMIAGLCAAGYHVVAPNFRGSTGYGEKYRLLNVGDVGGGDLEDVAAAGEWARSSGLASKVAVMGYSYGGYMTYLALGRKPDLWVAGVAGAGIVDWNELYELSDALFRKFIEELFDGLNRELMRERSPIEYVDGVKAPLCIVHPQNDSRTLLKPVLRYIEKLLENKATFELHVIPDMGHVMRSIDDVFRVLLPAVVFLNKYVREVS